ncbi:MAG TPA: polysaccharide deacetylase family protein [Syntrophomonadaceae bacterium]|nr:polysaccharide deacetylase family protein [Syntrophomonadaceae bacterium]
MKIYYFPKGNLKIVALLGLVLMASIGFALNYYKAPVMVSQQNPIYQGTTGQKNVAITVNVDWGEEYIPAMLDEFKKNNAKVTFFVTGRWAQKNVKLLQRMAKEGHSIQNHGYKHCHFSSLSSSQTAVEIKKADEVISGITGKKTAYFASPYGEFNRQIIDGASSIDYKLIMWSVDTIDWQRPSPYIIVNRVMNKVHNDAIILMHPTEPTVQALPDLLKQLKAQNYHMVTVDKILTSPSENNGNAKK